MSYRHLVSGADTTQPFALSLKAD